MDGNNDDDYGRGKEDNIGVVVALMVSWVVMVVRAMWVKKSWW